MLIIKIRLYHSSMKARPISEEFDCVTTKRGQKDTTHISLALGGSETLPFKLIPMINSSSKRISGQRSKLECIKA